MNKINKKSINYGFKTLTVLAFVLIFAPFNQAMAAPTWVPGHYNYNISLPAGCTSNLGFSRLTGVKCENLIYETYTFGDFYWPETTTPKETSSPAPAVNSTNNANTSNSNLAANSLFGSNSFLPSSLIQWILLAIIILLVVILVRKFYGAEEKYHATPMKHD